MFEYNLGERDLPVEGVYKLSSLNSRLPSTGQQPLYFRSIIRNKITFLLGMSLCVVITVMRSCFNKQESCSQPMKLLIYKQASIACGITFSSWRFLTLRINNG